mgnify:FL=1
MKVKKIPVLLLAAALSAFLLAGCSPQPEAVYPDFDASKVIQVEVQSNMANPPAFSLLSPEDQAFACGLLCLLTGTPETDPGTEGRIGMPTRFRFTLENGEQFTLSTSGGENYDIKLTTPEETSYYQAEYYQLEPWTELTGEYFDWNILD